MSGFCTYLFVKEKFDDYHGSIKPYNVDRLRKEQGIVDVR
jgi:hypothetical protein